MEKFTANELKHKMESEIGFSFGTYKDFVTTAENEFTITRKNGKWYFSEYLNGKDAFEITNWTKIKTFC